MTEKKLIVGLGNPGKRYRNTRHNIGFEVVDQIGSEYGIKIRKLKFGSLYGDGRIEGRDVLLVKPQTYMNRSGEAVREIVEWLRIPVNNIIVIYDDIDIPPGTIRIRPGGSAGTHNGMRSVIYSIERGEFPRVRIGIGRPPEGWDLVSYVLGRFSEGERQVMERAVVKAAKAVACAVTEGVEMAMSRYNGPVTGEADDILHGKTEGD